MMAEQEGLCALCQTEAATAIDHCHEKGHVRGILCNPCNLFIGWAELIGPDACNRLEEYLGTLSN